MERTEEKWREEKRKERKRRGKKSHYSTVEVVRVTSVSANKNRMHFLHTGYRSVGDMINLSLFTIHRHNLKTISNLKGTILRGSGDEPVMPLM